ncbi:hypothetical protein [Paraburkholderia solisilvae]|uniref:DUF2269 family protein n=2 Tax=Paraburkholderia solisilvae TaxID=624376 RepID=A0A6J5DN71_9BURK|nr:hypothetical protein LMG29739_02239 [Paraburkholderia solisilvae]
MKVLVWLHVACMFIGFAGLVSNDLLLWAVSRERASTVTREVVRRVGAIGVLGRILVVVGIAIGLLLARPFGYAAFWLIATYVLVGLSIVLGAAAYEPLKKRFLDSTGDSTPRQRNFLISVVFVNSVLWVAVIWLMLAKP